LATAGRHTAHHLGAPSAPYRFDGYTYTGLNLGYYRVETNATARYDYTFDKLRRMTQEKKRGTGQGTPLHYQKDFTYDKAGNRLSYQHQNGGGYNYGLACNYNLYVYDVMGRLTQIQDSGRSFTATVTNDWNGNITQISEIIPHGVLNATSTFEWDYENRLIEAAPGGSGMVMEFTWDGFNRAVKSRATIGMNAQDFEHIYSGSRFIGSKEVTDPENPVTGKVWEWGIGYGNHGKNELIEAAQISSASARNYYMLNDEKNTGRMSYINNAMTAGDTVDPARMCSETQQVNGAVTPCRVAIALNKSELVSAYAITLDADRAVYAYGGEGTLALLATDLEFEGSRVKSPVLGRDFNPMGRGDGAYYAQGAFAIYEAKSEFVGEITSGFGNSVCNGEAVPTALDLGGSPVHGANMSAAGECCGEHIHEPPSGSSRLMDWCTWLLEAIPDIAKVFSGEVGIKELMLHICSGPKNKIVQCVCDALMRLKVGGEIPAVWDAYMWCLKLKCGIVAPCEPEVPQNVGCPLTCWLSTIGTWILRNIVMPCMGKYLKDFACFGLGVWVQFVEHRREKAWDPDSASYSMSPGGNGSAVLLYALPVATSGRYSLARPAGTRAVPSFLALRRVYAVPNEVLLIASVDASGRTVICAR